MQLFVRCGHVSINCFEIPHSWAWTRIVHKCLRALADKNGVPIAHDQWVAVETSLGTDVFAVADESASPMRPRYATPSENAEVLAVEPLYVGERFSRRVEWVAWKSFGVSG